MGQGFKENACQRTDVKKFDRNFTEIDWRQQKKEPMEPSKNEKKQNYLPVILEFIEKAQDMVNASYAMLPENDLGAIVIMYYLVTCKDALHDTKNIINERKIRRES